MAKTNKYYVIWMNSGYGFGGWEVVDYFDNYSEAKRCVGEYRMNGGSYVMRSRIVRDGKDVLDCRFRG